MARKEVSAAGSLRCSRVSVAVDTIVVSLREEQREASSDNSAKRTDNPIADSGPVPGSPGHTWH
jgi:hypothetical protein